MPPTTINGRSHGYQCAGAIEELDRPPHGHQHRRGHERAREEVLATLPQHDGAHADEGADRGCERDRVVRVDDALPEAERDSGDEQPAAPQEERGARPVGAGCAPG